MPPPGGLGRRWLTPFPGLYGLVILVAGCSGAGNNGAFFLRRRQSHALRFSPAVGRETALFFEATRENQRRFAPQQNLYFRPLLHGHGA